MGVARRQFSVGGGGLGQRVGGRYNDPELACLDLADELEPGGSTDFGAGVSPRAGAEGLEAELAGPLETGDGDDPAAVGDQGDRRVDRLVAPHRVDGRVNAAGGKSTDPLGQARPRR